MTKTFSPLLVVNIVVSFSVFFLVYRLVYNGDIAAGQLAVFQGASEAPISELSVTYPFRYVPSYCQSGSDRLAGGPF
jgi:hypothetical protein